MTVFDYFVLGLGYGATALGIIIMLGLVIVFLCSLAAIFGRVFGDDKEDEEGRE